MTTEEKAVLIGLCRIEIKRWKVASESNPNMCYMVNLMEIALAALNAAGEPVPVWGQARFKGGDWSSCSAEHAAMVMASPAEWGDYECRYLYACPPAPIAPDGWKVVPVEPTDAMTEAGWDKLNVSGDMNCAYEAMIDAAPEFNGDTTK